MHTTISNHPKKIIHLSICLSIYLSIYLIVGNWGWGIAMGMIGVQFSLQQSCLCYFLLDCCFKCLVGKGVLSLEAFVLVGLLFCSMPFSILVSFVFSWLHLVFICIGVRTFSCILSPFCKPLKFNLIESKLSSFPSNFYVNEINISKWWFMITCIVLIKFLNWRSKIKICILLMLECLLLLIWVKHKRIYHFIKLRSKFYYYY